MKNGQKDLRTRVRAPKIAQANKGDLAQTIADRLSIPRRTAMVLLEGVLDSVTSLLQEGRRVAVKEFGTFEHRVRKGRVYKHPLTGESLDVEDKSTVYFKPSDRLREQVKKKG